MGPIDRPSLVILVVLAAGCGNVERDGTGDGGASEWRCGSAGPTSCYSTLQCWVACEGDRGCGQVCLDGSASCDLARRAVDCAERYAAPGAACETRCPEIDFEDCTGCLVDFCPDWSECFNSA